MLFMQAFGGIKTTCHRRPRQAMSYAISKLGSRCTMPPNIAFKPNSFRSTNSVAGTACHAVCSATRVGLT
jgi:hypothetical protein